MALYFGNAEVIVHQPSKDHNDANLNANALEEIEVGREKQAAAQKEPRRSQRTRTLTEKGQELQ